MRKLLLSVTIVLTICLAGCSNVSEQDLANLQSPNHLVKREAIMKISQAEESPFSFIRNFFGRSRENEAVSILVNMVHGGNEPEDIQVSILKALGNLGTRCQVPGSLLIKKLKDENSLIRLQAVEALGKLKEKEAVPALLELLEQEPNKYPVIWSLGEIADKRAVPALNALLSSKDTSLQYNARKALKKIR